MVSVSIKMDSFVKNFQYSKLHGSCKMPYVTSEVNRFRCVIVNTCECLDKGGWAPLNILEDAISQGSYLMMSILFNHKNFKIDEHFYETLYRMAVGFNTYCASKIRPPSIRKKMFEMMLEKCNHTFPRDIFGKLHAKYMNTKFNFEWDYFGDYNAHCRWADRTRRAIDQDLYMRRQLMALLVKDYKEELFAKLYSGKRVEKFLRKYQWNVLEEKHEIVEGVDYNPPPGKDGGWLFTRTWADVVLGF